VGHDETTSNEIVHGNPAPPKGLKFHEGVTGEFNPHASLEEKRDLIERVSGPPRPIHERFNRVNEFIEYMKSRPVATVSVTANDGDTEFGEIAIPAELFDEARKVATATITWGDGYFSVNFGHQGGLSIYVHKES
jgi:hypothetical protein